MLPSICTVLFWQDTNVNADHIDQVLNITASVDFWTIGISTKQIKRYAINRWIELGNVYESLKRCAVIVKASVTKDTL